MEHTGDFVKADFGLVVAVGTRVCLGVVITKEKVVDGECADACCLAELAGHEKQRIAHQACAVILDEAHDACELEHLDGRQLVRLPPVLPAELQELIKAHEVDGCSRVEAVGLQEP